MNDFENEFNPQPEQDNTDIPVTEPDCVEDTGFDDDETQITVEIPEPEPQPEPKSQPEPQPEPQPESQQQYYQNGQYPPPPPNFNNGDGYNPPPFNQVPPTPPQKNSNRGFKIFCGVLAIIVALTLGTGIGYVLNDGGNITNPLSEVESDIPDVEFIEDKVPTAEGIQADENGEYSEAEVSQLVSPSVVTIYTYNETDGKGSVSSGVIIDKNGYVITNDHIYSEIANAKFVVTLSNDISYPATFVAGDQKSDIAVIKIEGASDLTPASFGKSDEVKAGDKVIAIGTPNGFSNSVTAGIVSAANRRIRNVSTNSGSSTQTTSTYTMRVIQTDASLNHGNSGGALVNMKGQVVGINSSKIVLDSYEGICFAIPSNDAVKVAKSLIENKKVVGRARLGISYTEVTTAKSIINDMPSGLYIQSIDSDSDLYNRGASVGDIITEIDGKTITTADVALDVIADKPAGDSITLKIYSKSTGAYNTYTVKLLEDQSVSSYTTENVIESDDDENPFKLQPTTTK